MSNSAQTSASQNAEQLIELMLQLKKTTPESARAILNAQPPIAYALITLMVQMGAVDTNIVQQTLTAYHASQPSAAAVPPVAAPSAPQPSRPASAIPPHIQSNFRASTPPSQSHTPPNSTPSMYPNRSQSQYPPAQPAPYSQGSYPSYGQPPDPRYPAPQRDPRGYPGPPGDLRYNQGPSRPDSRYSSAPPPPQAQPDPLAAVSPEQRALLQSLFALTPEQINNLPPAERESVMKLRQSFGYA